MFGPILTTGVALSAAVVVVTNPVTAPHADVRIPAAQATVPTGQAVDMLDESFIQAVAPKPVGSTNPLSIFKDLVSTLIADAADLGREAVIQAFVAGANVVSRPELTAASYPYLPPGPETLPGPVPADLRPAVEQALAEIIASADSVNDAGVIAAAFVAGAALAAQPGPILDNLRAVLDSEFEPALDEAVSVLAAVPGAAVGDSVRAAVHRFVPSVPAMTDIAALPGRAAAPEVTVEARLLAGGAPAAGDDGLTRSVLRPARQTLDRVPVALRSVAVNDGLNSAFDHTVSAAPRISRNPLVEAVDAARAQRSSLAQAGQSAGGAIARTLQARTDRTPD